MSSNIVAERLFTDADQEWFASVSGDRNPMHMDALAARRTMAGFPVVHGIHTLLWTLDSLFRSLPALPGAASIKASFEKMVYVGDRVRVVLVKHDPGRLRIEAVIENTTIMGLDVEFGEPRAGESLPLDGPVHRPDQPYNLTFDQMEVCHGQVPLSDTGTSLAQAFPAATAALGIERVAALACSSFLVGMVCPGLHSIYRNLNLAMMPIDPNEPGGLHFRVKYSDPDYRLVRLAVSGGGWTGLIDTYGRPEPRGQADLASLATRVAPGAFAGTSALIIGGSRGLGELVAKILAAGGAHVTLTYAVGEADARRLQAEIVGFGGRCGIMRYDVRKNPAEQLLGLATVPTAMYFMATPMIAQRSSAVFSAKRLQEFLEFYVTGFSDLCEALRSHARQDVAVFYPSSVFVEERPAGMTEYAMAKAAGEVLCADMQALGNWNQIMVHRLPRLPTDQTATLYDDELDDPVAAMLPIVRQMHAGRAG